MKNKEQADKKEEKKEAVGNICKDDCPIHGNLRVRGRTFKGKIIKKFHKRIVVEFERTIFIKKYERYAKKKTRLHARLPVCKEKEVSVGDIVFIGECRPLSKIIHFVYIKKISGGLT